MPSRAWPIGYNLSGWQQVSTDHLGYTNTGARPTLPGYSSQLGSLLFDLAGTAQYAGGLVGWWAAKKGVLLLLKDSEQARWRLDTRVWHSCHTQTEVAATLLSTAGPVWPPAPTAQAHAQHCC
jgi:hypothetical protein